MAVTFGKFLGVLLPAVTPGVFLSLAHLPMPGGAIEIGVSWQGIVALGVVGGLTLLNARGVRRAEPRAGGRAFHPGNRGPMAPDAFTLRPPSAGP